MAGDWIKMRGNLWDDPRVARICDMTDSGEAAVVGALYWLWSTADQHTEDGCMPGLTLRQIDRKTGLQGFGAALVEVGWLRDDPQGVVIANFEEHNGTSAKRRATDAQRKANSRNVSASDADNTRTEEGQKTPDCGAREREEKRREETHSEANASDADAAVDEVESAKAALWRESVVVLKAGGCPESLCRSFMGKLVKDYTEATVREAVTAAISAQPADAREYLKATCQRLKGERKDPITVPSTDTGAEKFKAAMDERAATATRPPAEVLALARKAVRAA